MDDHGVELRFKMLQPILNEQFRRLLAAAEAMAIGYGGVSSVSRRTGVSRRAIAEGITELKHPERAVTGRIRRSGGGRKRTAVKDITLMSDLESLVEPNTRGDPESPLRWTCKSLRRLSDELNRMGHTTSRQLVADLLHEMDYSLQANQKVREGDTHPDRNSQFEHINAKAKEFRVIGDSDYLS